MKAVLKHLGYLLLIFSIFPILPFWTAIFYRESFLPYLLTGLLSFLLGMALLTKKFNMENDPKRKLDYTALDIPRSIALFAMCFVMMSFIGALPYVIAVDFSPLDATFESFSGFTTTGLTVIDDVEIMPKSLLLWRAETQWIGGLGIILLFLMIVSGMRRQDSLRDTTTRSRAIASLYQAQGASEKLEANMRKSIRRTAIIYAAYTLLGIILLAILGLSVFEAVSISFTAISTAGFSVTNEFYTSWSILIVVMFIILAGAVSFVVHNKLFKLELREVLRNKIFLFYLFFIFGGFLILWWSTLDLKVALFETVTAFTTTGYTIAEVALLPHIAIMVMMIGMIVGGMLGSTCGGIKVNRLVLTLKSIPWMVRKTAAPRGAVIPLKMEGKLVEEGTLWITHAYVACYMVILAAGTLVLMLTDIGFLDSSFQVVSALGGVGLSTAAVSGFNAVAKIVLIIAMLFGRLEIFPVLVMGKTVYDAARKKVRKAEEDAQKSFYTMRVPSKLWKRKH
ncbi:TrkH family potassium uptake protein [Candidatus Woesearchaeota archaeon]|nr:TrkH family potassium uptake protein [Candidatus Woesearchaeota archaeon]